LAANSRVYDCIIEPELAKENIDILFNVLEYARTNNIKKIFFASSREVYADSKDKSIEIDTSINSINPYAASKIAGEALLSSYKKCYGIDYVIFRLSNVYGVYDEYDRVIPQYIINALKDQKIKIYGSKKILDFVYIDDVLQCVIKVVNNFNLFKNNIFNIGTGEGITLQNLADQIINTIGSKSRIEIIESRLGEVNEYISNINKAENVLKYKVRYSLDDGLNKAIQWYEKNKKYEV